MGDEKRLIKFTWPNEDVLANNNGCHCEGHFS